MLWMILISIVVVIAAGCSLGASWDSRRDIAGGHPTFDSVADATGIWNRLRLDRLLGPRDAEDRYTTTCEKVYAIPRARWKRLFGSELADTVCILLAVASPFFYQAQQGFSIGLLAAAGLYVLAGYVVSFIVVSRDGSQDQPGRHKH